MKKNKLTKFALALGAVATIAAPVAAVVSCGSESYDNTHIRVAYEKSWKPVIQKAVQTLSPEEQKKIDLVELADGKSVDYLDQVTNKPSAGATADLFASPVDHFSSLVSGNVLQDLDTNFDSSLYQSDSIGKIDGKHYAFPINTESVIQIFNKDDAGDNGFATLKDAFDNDKFVTQWGNLWHASAAMNAAIDPSTDGASDSAAEQWVKEGTDGKWTAPILENANAEAMAKVLFDENNKLRNSDDKDDAWKVNIANNTDRDANIRAGLASGDISGTIDGPWAINDLVARIVKLNKDDSAKMATALGNLSAAALPTVGAVTGIDDAKVQASQLRHFKGGWGYAINRQKLSTLDPTEGSVKEALEVKFLKALTSANLATGWFEAGGKLSAAAGAKIEMTEDIVKNMKISDPTDPKGPAITLPDDASVVTALTNLYTAVNNAVSTQASFNVDQPSGKAWALWDSWDKNGLSKSANKTANDFWEGFETSVKQVITDANK